MKKPFDSDHLDGEDPQQIEVECPTTSEEICVLETVKEMEGMEKPIPEEIEANLLEEITAPDHHEDASMSPINENIISNLITKNEAGLLIGVYNVTEKFKKARNDIPDSDDSIDKESKLCNSDDDIISKPDDIEKKESPEIGDGNDHGDGTIKMVDRVEFKLIKKGDEVTEHDDIIY